MKAIKTIVFALALTTLWVGCGQNKQGELEVISEGSVTLSPDGETKSVIVIASTDWGVSATGNEGNWLTWKVSDKNLTLTAGANTGLETRTAVVTVSLSGGSPSRTLTVAQNAKPQTISVSPNSLPTVPKEGGEYDITVTHSQFVELNINVPARANWVGVGTLSGDKLKLTIGENTAAEPRSALIVFADKKGNADSAPLNITQAGGTPLVDPNDPSLRGYTLMSEMQPAASLVGLGFADQVWSGVHNDMRKYGWDYSEHPNNATGDHNTDTHVAVEWDAELEQNVYHFFSHCHPGAVDGDRGPAIGGDRMRNEMKSQTSQTWYKMNGNYDEWQILEWKMNIPAGWAPTSSFCHIHQLKGQEGSDIGSPLITLTLRNDNAHGRHLEVIHTPRAGGTKVANPVDNISLDDIEGEWLQVQQEVNFKRNGYYKIVITRVSDGSTVVSKEVPVIDTWRAGGCLNIRNKWGIYRSYNNGDYDGVTLPNLKDESIWLADFKVWEKNSNNTAPTAVND